MAAICSKMAVYSGVVVVELRRGRGRGREEVVDVVDVGAACGCGCGRNEWNAYITRAAAVGEGGDDDDRGGSNARACEQRREQRWVRVMEASEDRGEVIAGKGRAPWLLEGTAESSGRCHQQGRRKGISGLQLVRGLASPGLKQHGQQTNRIRHWPANFRRHSAAFESRLLTLSLSLLSVLS
jgi:hypothetical protein